MHQRRYRKRRDAIKIITSRAQGIIIYTHIYIPTPATDAVTCYIFQVFQPILYIVPICYSDNIIYNIIALDEIFTTTT